MCESSILSNRSSVAAPTRHLGSPTVRRQNITLLVLGSSKEPGEPKELIKLVLDNTHSKVVPPQRFEQCGPKIETPKALL